MSLFGIGIDVVEVARIEQSLAQHGERFLARIFTQEEQAYCERQARPRLHYAARFAAKEAVSKAFGTGIGKDVSWTEIEVTRKVSGEPEILLSGQAAAFAEKNAIREVKISLSHAEHYAAANAVALL